MRTLTCLLLLTASALLAIIQLSAATEADSQESSLMPTESDKETSEELEQALEDAERVRRQVNFQRETINYGGGGRGGFHGHHHHHRGPYGGSFGGPFGGPYGGPFGGPYGGPFGRHHHGPFGGGYRGPYGGGAFFGGGFYG